MLQRIEARTFQVHLLRESKEAKEGTATIFHIRQMSHKEATLYDLDLMTLEANSRTLDRENKGREVIGFRNGKFAEVVEKIEKYGDGTGEPITDPVKIKAFPSEYLNPDDVEFLLRQARTGFLLPDMDAEIRKNALRSSPGSSDGSATTQGDTMSSTV